MNYLGVRIKIGLPVKMIKMSHNGLKGKYGLPGAEDKDGLPGGKSNDGHTRSKW